MSTLTQVRCGCGKHVVSLTDDKLVHYDNEWWKLRCLFTKVDKRMPKILKKFETMQKEIDAYRKMRLKFVKMKRYMKQLACDNCGHHAGNRFKQEDDQLWCGTCYHQERS